VSDVERKSVLHGGAGNAGSVEVVEERHIRVRGAKTLDTLVKGDEEFFDEWDERWRVGKCAQEKEALVKADYVVRIEERQFRKICEESGDE
jgi:hypothetical protein